ncbi:MAG: SDR family NAD(P)-dependent oxidoreductase, partial [Deltaproteobacteria bacterium]|nr:SDR family NAD(P)-dependent oxidoreductase [Deltaproteobacteria bacterium]
IIGAGGGVADLGIKYSIRSFLPLLEQISGGKIQSDRFISDLKGFLPEWTEDSFPGILMNVAAGRVANRFDMGGSNFTVDAACASSMAAVYLGVKELQTFSSDMVVVGGSDTMQNPFTFLCFSKTQALSPTGRSCPLDESADGIVLGEGVAVAILKRLADAERDGDRIYAVIKSVGSSSDGRDKCLTAPRPEGQISALERAYDQAGICPSTIGLIETHGTGTEVGDRTEVQALSHVFKNAQAKNQSCAIGAVKSMIGHTKCTSGVAGLIKTAMALYSKTLPPTLNITHPNRKANFAQTPFYVNTDTRPWFNSINDHPRRAGVSAFGFGGTNFHTVLEEYTQDFSDGIPETFYRQWPGELCVWAANSREELQKKVNKISKDLKEWKGKNHPPLLEIAYSQWKEMQSIDKSALADVRLAVIASSLDDLYQKLDRVKEMLLSSDLLDIQDPRGIYLIERAARVKGKVAFLFPGQGAQYLDMVKDLVLNFPEVLSCFERLDKILQPKIGRALSDYIFPRPVFTDEEKADQQKALTRTSIAQPAIGAVSVALCQLLSELKICPDMVAGHSYGEYVALWAGGSLTEESLMLLSEARGRIVEEAVASCPGTMAAMNVSKDKLSEIVSGKEGVWMANYNSPHQTVISGISESVQAVVQQCKDKGIKARMLPVSCAFHSPLVRPAQEKIAEFLNSLTILDAKLPVYSNTTANPHSCEAQNITQHMIDHLTHPVKFMQEIEAMYEADARIFIEVGPRSILTNLVSQILEGRPHTSVALDQIGRSSLLQLQYCLGQLIVQGLPVNLDRLYSGRIDQKEASLQKKDDSLSLSKSSNTWLIRGDRIRPPQAESSQTKFNGQTHFTKKINKVALQTYGKQKEATEKHSENSEIRKDNAIDKDLSIPKTGDLIMHQFQQMMNKFLDTQKMVMAGYLRTGFSEKASEAEKHPVTAQNTEESVDKKTVQEEYKNEASQQESSQDREEIQDVPILPDKQDRQKVQELLLRIVSERTGYPSEMLGLDLDMEADLGIDSIKRVEILGSLQEEIGGSCQGEEESEKEMGEFSGIKTLQGIIDWITQSGEINKDLTANEKESIAQEADEEKDIKEEISEKGDIQRFLVDIVKTPYRGDQIAFDKNRIVVITEDQKGLARFLDGKLQEQGYKVARIRMGDSVEEIEPGYYATNLGLYEDVDSLLSLIRQRQGPVGALIHLYPFRSDQGVFEMDLIQWKRLLKLEVKSLFYLAKSLETELRDAASHGASCLMAVTSMGGSFGSGCLQFTEGSLKPSPLGMQTFSPTQGGCAGLIKSLKYEWPEINLKVVDLNPEDKKEDLAQYLLDEMRFGQDEVEVGYQQGDRFTLQPLLSSLSLKSESQMKIDSSWTLLLTGGARGITSDVAKELARQYQPTLLLVGSSPFPEEEAPFEISGSLQEIKARLIAHMKLQGEVITPVRVESKYHQLMKAQEIRTNVKAIQELGSRVQYFQADVRDERSLAELIDNIYRSYEKIDGVIHGAGIIEDKFIKDKTLDSFDRVFDTKVDSAFILSQKLHLDSLKFLVFFSSVAGRFGNRGQGDYAAANEVLNKLAIYLNARWPARVVSINWGPWENSNMVSPLLDKEFKKHGIQLIPRDTGPQRLDQEICYGGKGDAEIILGGGWKAPINKQKQINQQVSYLVEEAVKNENNPPLGQRRVKEDFQPAKAFPLLDSGMVFSPNGKGIVEIVRDLDVANDLYLQDHKLNGNPVLPMTMALELMVETVSLGWPEWRIERVRDLRVLKGVVVSRPTKVHIKATPSQPDFSASEDLSVKVEMKDAQTPSLCRYSTIVELKKKHNNSFRWQPLALSEAKPFPMSTREAYQQWLFHGPLFHGISEIHQIGANGINGVLIPSSPKKLLAGDPKG